MVAVDIRQFIVERHVADDRDEEHAGDVDRPARDHRTAGYGLPARDPYDHRHGTRERGAEEERHEGRAQDHSVDRLHGGDARRIGKPGQSPEPVVLDDVYCIATEDDTDAAQARSCEELVGAATGATRLEIYDTADHGIEILEA
jgi:hypothetical protein